MSLFKTYFFSSQPYFTILFFPYKEYYVIVIKIIFIIIIIIFYYIYLLPSIELFKIQMLWLSIFFRWKLSDVVVRFFFLAYEELYLNVYTLALFLDGFLLLWYCRYNLWKHNNSINLYSYNFHNTASNIFRFKTFLSLTFQ